MFRQIHTAADVRVTFTPPNASKSYHINPTNLVNNVMLTGYNRWGNFVQTNSEYHKWGLFPSDIRGSSGPINLGIVLKPEYNPSTGECLIGAGTSNDPDQNNYSGTLQITFSDSAPSGSSQPVTFPGAIQPFYTMQMGGLNEYFLDLKSLSNNKRYCRIQVKPDPNQPDSLLIEGHLYIHIPTVNTQSTNKPIVIYGEEPGDVPSPEKGWPTAFVCNKDIYLDLQENEFAFLIPFVKFTGNNPYKFEIGDPKDDADIQIDEV